MTPEQEQAELLLTVREIRTALVGDLSGKNPGALHLLATLCESFDRLEKNTKEQIGRLEERIEIQDKRIRKLEEEKQRRAGFLIACSVGGSLIGFLISSLIALLKSGK